MHTMFQLFWFYTNDKLILLCLCFGISVNYRWDYNVQLS